MARDQRRLAEHLQRQFLAQGKTRATLKAEEPVLDIVSREAPATEAHHPDEHPLPATAFVEVTTSKGRYLEPRLALHQGCTQLRLRLRVTRKNAESAFFFIWLQANTRPRTWWLPLAVGFPACFRVFRSRLRLMWSEWIFGASKVGQSYFDRRVDFPLWSADLILSINAYCIFM
jgi:hypothetical protein